MAINQSNREVNVEAPANIALIKYMGKADVAQHIPANASVSLTLNSLCTKLSVSNSPKDVICDFSGNALSEKATAKFQKHLDRMRSELPEFLKRYDLYGEIPAGVKIQSENTFPQGAGIASSASSFAALTTGFAAFASNSMDLFKEKLNRDDFRIELGALSRLGSGSSCRSFLGPWVSWSGEKISRITADLPKFSDIVIVIDAKEKEVSSSEAHLRVPSSPLWNGRAERANHRAKVLHLALQEGHTREIARLAREEMMEMHSLFHTSEEPFTYWTPGTLEVFRWLKGRSIANIKPIITMDAGPNIHLLIPESAATEWVSALKSAFGQFDILEDIQGTGVRIV